MFATIIVVLPSQFTGGEVHLSYRGLKMVYDCSATSLNSTTVMAWHPDTTHEIKPTKSGYRLALSYEMIHTATSLPSAISTNPGFVEKILRVLHAWSKSTAPDIPQKLVYLLDEIYSPKSLKSSALKGTDGIKVSLLRQVAEQAGFSLGLATASCDVEGIAEDTGPSDDDYWGRRHYRNTLVGFAEVKSMELTIEDLVDLKGVMISDHLEIDEKTETIPPNLAEVVSEGDHDDQDYDGYMGDVSHFSHTLARISF